jgi:hypothetical protein
MWQANYEQIFPGLTKEAVWSAWVNVNGWSRWDDDIDFAQIAGPFQEGSEFVLKPKGGPKITIRLASVVPLKSFTDVTRFPLAQMYDVHEMTDTPSGLRIRSTIQVEGPLGWLWRRIVAQGVAAGVPKQMEALARFARASTAEGLEGDT